MQYALMIVADPALAEGMSEAERDAVVAEFAEINADPRVLARMQLQPRETATTVRVEGGRTLMTDGPFADTKEVLGGVCLLEAADFDEAVEFAARIPIARLGGGVEIRPVVPR